MYESVKQCKNILCGNLIYPHQDAWGNEYCDKQCEQEVQHFLSVGYMVKRRTDKDKEKAKRRGKYAVMQEIYPHKYLPIQIVI